MFGIENLADGTNGSAFNDKLKLIRFRMHREKLNFWQEVRLVPRRLVWLMVALYPVAMVVAQIIHYYEGPEWPQLSAEMNRWILAGAVTGGSVFVAGLVFWTGYVNRDAKRRGMNATLWTTLVIVLFPAYLVTGFIIYYLLREPLPYNCPNCSATVSARFNFCPACQYNLRPSCSRCRREVGLGDRFCPHCANPLEAHDAGIPAES